MSEGYKKAALRLHGLNENDRRWLLGRLPDQDRSELLRLLAELSTMQIPSVSTVFSDYLEAASLPYTDSVTPSHAPVMSPADVLAAADPAVITRLLRGEPDWMNALVLRAGDWPWTEAFLKTLGDEERARLYSALQQVPQHLGAQLHKHTLEIVEEAVATESPKATSDTPSGLEALFQRLGAPSTEHAS